MQKRTRAVLAIVVAIAVAVGSYFLLREDPAAAKRAEGQRLWQEAVWFPERRRFADSVNALQEARRMGVADDDVLFMLASGYLFEGDSARAFEIASALSDRTPNHPGGHLLRGYVMRSQRDQRAAWAAFQASVALLGGAASRDPLRKEIDYLGRWWRAEQDLFLGNFERAVIDFDLALGAHVAHGSTPPDVLVLSAVAAHKRANEHDRGLAILTEALQRSPGQPSFLLQRALLLADQSSEQAEGAFEAAAMADPRNPTPLLKLAALDRLNGRLPSMYGRLLNVADLIESLVPAMDPRRLDLHRAELAAGMARYWLEVGKARRAAGDEPSSNEAFDKSLFSARESARLFPDCVRVHAVIRQLHNFIDVPEDVLEESRQKLERGFDTVPAISDAARTFC